MITTYLNCGISILNYFGVHSLPGAFFIFFSFLSDACRSTLLAATYDDEIKSPGYPKNYKVNSTCEYHIDVSNPSNVIHIGFKELFFGPNDMFTMYDTNDNSVIFGPFTGPQDGIRTVPFNSTAVKIVIRTKVASPSVKQKYVITFKEVPRGKFDNLLF